MRNLSIGTHAKSGEVMDWSYYDSITLLSTTLSFNMFQSAVGQSSKRLDQTNMTANGLIPTGQRFTIHRVKILYTGQAGTWVSAGTAQLQYLFTALNKSTLEFKIPGKDSLLVLTLQELLGDALQIVVAPTTAGNSLDAPKCRFSGIFPLNKPIILAEQTSFGVLVTHQVANNAALDTDILKISLNGILERRS